MALRALQGPTGGGAPVGGSGTSSPSTIPRWTGPSTLGDSVITQDGSIIGIRQATPSAYLAGFNTLVVGDAALANTGITLVSGTASDGTLAFADGTVGNAAYRGYIQYKHTTDTMQIGTAASPQITILSTGNVGIGTASPAGKLDVADAASASIYISRPGLSAVYGAAGLGNLRWRDTANAFDAAQISAVGYFPGSNGQMTFSTAAGGTMIERMRIATNASQAASQVAIGTSSFTSGCSLTVTQSIDASQSGQGLKLPATPGNPDTQTLDAYQEMGSGTYAASTATLTCGTSGTITLKTTSDQNKLYVTRIGRTVHVSGFLVVDSVSSPTGRLTITTSPALPAVQNGAGANIVFTGPTGLVAGDLIQPTISASTIFCDVYNGGVQSQTGAAKMQANTSLWVSFSYHAA